MTADWAAQAQRRAVAQLDACDQMLYHEADHGAHESCPECPPDVAQAPYDGCTECLVREVLLAAYPVLAELAVATYLSLLPGEEPPWRTEL